MKPAKDRKDRVELVLAEAQKRSGMETVQAWAAVLGAIAPDAPGSADAEVQQLASRCLDCGEQRSDLK